MQLNLSGRWEGDEIVIVHGIGSIYHNEEPRSHRRRAGAQQNEYKDVMATQVLAHAHEDFLRLFHSREAKLRGKPAVDALNNAQHAALRKKLESVHFIPPVWSLATQKGVADTTKRRERYVD
ncbi:uncharacterized protein B0I36DRAFT_134803 [Microdochium trichocladiopsis]|uniref:Uncharacterized protein n=1 Tax=Microdochium trichocladiopsis TaxID=1682393 RepID=A0A9P8Y5G6_9PEZI|nr:uncharacterized protein B0I36DRAFT_134803 [Microdochium trichocladiopsis]KAH7029675.1 hypothetical protein B0I36DRAFT_134803 [Microdochium trichocladiopsis]